MEISNNQDIVDSIVKDILTEIPNLKENYQSWISDYDDEPEVVTPGMKLGFLAQALMDHEDEPPKREVFKSFLKIVESYLQKYKNDKEILGYFEIMLFETILNIISSEEDDKKKQEYYDILWGTLGPISKKLCEENKQAWAEFVDVLEQSRKKQWEDLLKEYKERTGKDYPTF